MKDKIYRARVVRVVPSSPRARRARARRVLGRGLAVLTLAALLSVAGLGHLAPVVLLVGAGWAALG